MKTQKLLSFIFTTSCCCIFFISTAVAQAVIKTIVPGICSGNVVVAGNHGSGAITFDLNAIPADADLVSAYINFVCSERRTEQLTLSVFDQQMPDSILGYSTLYGGTPANEDVHIDLKTKGNYGIANSFARTKQLKLILKAQNGIVSDAEAKFYGEQDNPAFIPHLIIYYTEPVQKRPDWASSRADQMHSANNGINYRGAPITALGNKSFQLDNIMSNMAMYKGKIYLVADVALKGTKLYAIDPLNNGEESVNGFAKRLVADGLPTAEAMPAIDNRGNMYYVAANEILVMQLNDDTPKVKKAIVVDRDKSVNVALTIGRDGSVFAVFGNIVKAFSPYPQHKLIWQYSDAGNKSPVTLNKDGSIAYVLNYSEKKIIAINTDNGNRISFANLSLNTADSGATIPLVTNDGYLFVANRLYNADSMSIFDSKLRWVKSVGGGRISQPTYDKDQIVYFVRGDSLVKFTGLAYSPVTKWLSIPSGTARSLVCDYDGNVFGLYKEGAAKTYLCGWYGVGGKNIGPYPFEFGGVSKAMIMGPDGNLYFTTSRDLVRVNPVFSEDYTLSQQDKSASNAIFRAKAINVPAGFELTNTKTLIGSERVTLPENIIIPANADITLVSGGGITMKKGFKVKRGAKFACKSGY